MIWHPQFSQHWNQFGFAFTTAFLDPTPLPGVEFVFTCNDCGAELPQVIIELTLFFWSFTLVAHKEEQ